MILITTQLLLDI